MRRWEKLILAHNLCFRLMFVRTTLTKLPFACAGWACRRKLVLCIHLSSASFCAINISLSFWFSLMCSPCLHRWSRSRRRGGSRTAGCTWWCPGSTGRTACRSWNPPPCPRWTPPRSLGPWTQRCPQGCAAGAWCPSRGLEILTNQNVMELETSKEI